MATENLYLVLDLFLGPAILDFKKLQAEVNKKVIVWNRNPTAYAHQLDVAQKLLARGSAPGMNDGGTLTTQATEARLTREEFGKEKAASYEDDGRLEQMEVEAHIKEFARYFNPKTIRSGIETKAR